MKILRILRKKWLCHRVYKYTLKYNDSLSKSDHYHGLSKSYNQAALDIESIYGARYHECLEYCKLCQEYKFKGDHYKHLADIYLSKKLDLEEELQYLNYRKV